MHYMIEYPETAPRDYEHDAECLRALLELAIWGPDTRADMEAELAWLEQAMMSYEFAPF